MRLQGEEAAVRVAAAVGAEHQAKADSCDVSETRERYLRLLSWVMRIAVIGVAMWLIGTPLQSGATALVV